MNQTMLAAARREDHAGVIPLRNGTLMPILQRVALAANSSLIVDQVLERLAELTLEAVPGDRCSVFLLDEQARLVPRMAAGRVPNDAEFQRFLRTEPIDLKADATRWAAFAAGRALYISDLATSPLVPEQFVEAFGARCAVVTPLVASGEALGLLSVDWMEPDQHCTDEQIGLIEAIGAYVALAIRNSRLYEGLETKSRTLERLVDLARSLNSAASLKPVLELVCGAFGDLLGASRASVRLIDARTAGSVRTVAQSGARADLASEGALSALARTKVEAEISTLDQAWKRSAKPIVYADAEDRPSSRLLGAVPDSGSVVLFPLLRSDELLGYVVAVFTGSKPPDDYGLATGQALAELAAAATGRAHLHQELNWRLQRSEILHRLSDVVAGSAELGPTLRRLNDVVPSEFGIKLVSICLANPQLREAIGARAPDRGELEAIRSWRAIMAKGSSSPSPRQTDEGLLVPIAHRRRVLGALKVAVADGFSLPDDELLLAIASGCAEVVHKGGLHRELSDSEQRLAVVAERERIARDLHDSVGQVLTGLGMQLVAYAEEATDPVWRTRLAELRDLATRGSDEIREAIHSMLFLQVRREGLARSLRDLARKFEATTGIEMRLRVSGDVVSFPTAAEDALFRVAHEALRNAERHSGATSVSVSLTYSGGGASVTVNDNGVGLGDKDPFEYEDGHFGLQGLHSLLEEVGGELAVCDLLPHGVRVEGRVAHRRRASDTRA